MAKFGPLDNSETCVSMRGLLDDFFTCLNFWVSGDGGVVVAVVADAVVVEPDSVVALAKVLAFVKFE